MAAKKKSPPPSESTPSKAPVYLSTSDPPKPHLAFLIIMVIVAVAWIAGLVFLALQQAGVA
ncbi:hypothetical protein GC197_12870 [bacterium]|nr:hypothetical protein [bacterium]